MWGEPACATQRTSSAGTPGQSKRETLVANISGIFLSDWYDNLKLCNYRLIPIMAQIYIAFCFWSYTPLGLLEIPNPIRIPVFYPPNIRNRRSMSVSRPRCLKLFSSRRLVTYFLINEVQNRKVVVFISLRSRGRDGPVDLLDVSKDGLHRLQQTLDSNQEWTTMMDVEIIKVLDRLISLDDRRVTERHLANRRFACLILYWKV